MNNQNLKNTKPVPKVKPVPEVKHQYGSPLFRRFTFTQYDLSTSPNIKHKNIKYMIYQMEMCPTTKRKHYQGFCILNTRMRLKKIQKEMFQGISVHIEKPNKCDKANASYCSKRDTRISEPIEIGETPKPGFRNDIYKEILLDMENMLTIEEIAKKYPEKYIKYHCRIDK